MLHYLACLALAVAITKYLATRYKSVAAAVLSTIGGLLVGWVIGTLVVAGWTELLGGAVNKNALLVSFGRAFWWALIGAVIGVIWARQTKGATPKPPPGWALAGIGVFIAAGMVAGMQAGKAAPQAEPSVANTLTPNASQAISHEGLKPFDGQLDHERKLVPFTGKLDGEK